jgi:hypothetical protein
MRWLKYIFLFGQVQIHYFYYSVSNQYYVYIRPFPFSDQTLSIASYLHMGCLYLHCFFSLLATALFAGERYSKMFIFLVCLDIVWVANYFARYGEDFLLPTFDMMSVKAILYLVIIGLYKARIKFLRHATT